MSDTPSPILIKLHNTAKLAQFVTQVVNDNSITPATAMGASITVFVQQALRQARSEGVVIAQRNLTRQVALLQGLLQQSSADAMERYLITESEKRVARARES